MSAVARAEDLEAIHPLLFASLAMARKGEKLTAAETVMLCVYRGEILTHTLWQLCEAFREKNLEQASIRAGW